jgi:hypothetical protein
LEVSDPIVRRNKKNTCNLSQVFFVKGHS